MAKKALITGVCGQDGAYMSKLLLAKGYQVFGVARSLNSDKTWRLKELGVVDKIELIDGDITDASTVFEIFREIKPDECYNFAAISFVSSSWKSPVATIDIDTKAVLNLLEAIRQNSPGTKLYQAGSAEMFGRPNNDQQNENTPFAPCNPYGSAKAAAFNLVNIYRRAYGIFGCNAICYNHESPLRGIEYVTRKITDAVVKIKSGMQNELRLGNINSRRDWGSAEDYVQAMWSMLQNEVPDDYVLAMGTTHSIKEFLEAAFSAVGITEWQKYVIEDKKFYRPVEPNLLCGDASKANKILGWKPVVSFEELVKTMIDAELQRLSK